MLKYKNSENDFTILLINKTFPIYREIIQNYFDVKKSKIFFS